MGDDIDMDGVTRSIQEQTEGELPLGTNRFETIILTEFLRLHEVMQAREDEHKERLIKNISEGQSKEIEVKLEGIEGMSQSIVDSLTSNILKQIESNNGVQPLDTNRVETIILKEFLRLHEVQLAREDEHKKLLNQNISLLKQMKKLMKKTAEA